MWLILGYLKIIASNFIHSTCILDFKFKFLSQELAFYGTLVSLDLAKGQSTPTTHHSFNDYVLS